MSGSLVTVESGQIRVLPSFADMLIVARLGGRFAGASRRWIWPATHKNAVLLSKRLRQPRTTPEFDALLVPPEPQPEAEAPAAPAEPLPAFLPMKQPAEPEVPVPDGMLRRPWRHQKTAFKFCIEHFRAGLRGILLAMGMGCIEGDAEVIVNRRGCARRMTIREFHRKFHGGETRGRCWRSQLGRVRGLMRPKALWPATLIQFEALWSEYKRENGLLDFTDLIETCLRDVRVAPKNPSVIRNAMSGVITKATEWEIIPRSYANPIQWVKLPKKWEVFEKRILSPEQTAQVMARLEEPNLLICETCLDTGTRISEVTGLMIKHVVLDKGIIRIEQRHCRGDIDVPKTAKSKRTLTLGGLTERYKDWIEGLRRKGPNDWVFPQDEDLGSPRWDSGVRKALKEAARSIRADGAPKEDRGLDFPGFGPHSLRRANITWRQEVGGSSIETSKIAGHASTAITEEYTLVGLNRQDDLTRLIQEKRAKAARTSKAVASQPPVSDELAAQRERACTARAARKDRKANVVEMKKEAAA
jgi:integrase